MIKMAFNDIKCISGYIFATIKSIINHEPVMSKAEKAEYQRGKKMGIFGF